MRGLGFPRIWGRAVWASLAVVCVAISFVPRAHAQKEMSVQVRSSPVREKPKVLAKVLGKLSYGTRVKVLDAGNRAWLKVQAPSEPGTATPKKMLAGWMRLSALTKKKLRLRAGASVGALASADEVALAGKGFDEEVERVYRRKNRNLDRAFARLDQLERDPSSKVEPQAVADFLRVGGVNPREES